MTETSDLPRRDLRATMGPARAGCRSPAPPGRAAGSGGLLPSRQTKVGPWSSRLGPSAGARSGALRTQGPGPGRARRMCAERRTSSEQSLGPGGDGTVGRGRGCGSSRNGARQQNEASQPVQWRRGSKEDPGRGRAPALPHFSLQTRLLLITHAPYPNNKLYLITLTNTLFY